MSVLGFRWVMGVLVLELAACSQNSSPPAARDVSDAAQESPFEITATIRELMDSTVDPAADALWDSVAVTSTLKGVEETQPKTDADWAALRRNAVTLMESMNLVVMRGRHAAPPGTKAALGELSPAEIDQQMVANRGPLVAFAKALRATAQEALTAIDKKDVEGLFKAGSAIDEACEACHVTFWYPNTRVPQT